MKLCLGTAQLGLKYGVNNQLGRKPSDEEAYEILRLCRALEIQYIDTAIAYGNAEELIGDSGILDDGCINIITKIPGNIDDDYFVLLRKSLNKLKVDCIDGVLLHDYRSYENGLTIKKLLALKQSGLAHRIGVSVYEPYDALKVAQDGIVDYIQVPYNVLDQRLDGTDFFRITKKNGLFVFARSAYLQGLILMDNEAIPEGLRGVIPYLRKMNDVAEEYGYTRKEAAFLFACSHRDIDSVVFGVDTVEQLLWNTETAQKVDSFLKCRLELEGIASGIDEKIINPSMWRS